MGSIPDLVALPSTAAQAAELMKLAGAENWRVSPAGAGTWTAIAFDPRVSVVVSATRMAQVYDYEPSDPGASIGAGVLVAAFATLTAGERQWLPLDPPGAAASTIGAIVGLGAAGPLRQGYGTPREHVLGLELVTGDG